MYLRSKAISLKIGFREAYIRFTGLGVKGMLNTLSIRNLAVVESVDVQFYPGFHVLTGETGAGKSIIIDALGLIAGGRGSADLIRYGCDKAEIEALFDLPRHIPCGKH